MKNATFRIPGRAGNAAYRRPRSFRRYLKSGGQPSVGSSNGYNRPVHVRHRSQQLTPRRSIAAAALSSVLSKNDIITVDYPHQGSYISLEIVQTR